MGILFALFPNIPNIIIFLFVLISYCNSIHVIFCCVGKDDSIKSRLRKRPSAINGNSNDKPIPAKRSNRLMSAPVLDHVQNRTKNVRKQDSNRLAGVPYASSSSSSSSKTNGTSKAKKTTNNAPPSSSSSKANGNSSSKSSGPSINVSLNSVPDKLIDINCTLLAEVHTLNNDLLRTTDAIIRLQAEKHQLELKCIKLAFKIDKLNESFEKLKAKEEGHQNESQDLILFDASVEEFSSFWIIYNKVWSSPSPKMPGLHDCHP